MLFRLYHTGAEALFEQMALASVTPVEPLSVDAVDAVHALRKRRLARFEKEVVVSRHQAIGVALPPRGKGCVDEEVDEGAAI
jgi:hypothetical protein